MENKSGPCYIIRIDYIFCCALRKVVNNMSGLWSRGYNGDCRDCFYYPDNFHRSIYQDGYKCDYSGEYFDDRYGEQCHCFYDLAEVKAAEEKRERQENALKGIILADGVAESQVYEECNSYERSDSSGGWFILCSLIVVGSLITIAEKQINHTFFWPVGSWSISYIIATIISVVANKKFNRVTLIFLPIILTIIFMIIMSLATGNNYFSIWLYQPDLGAYKRMYIFN